MDLEFEQKVALALELDRAFEVNGLGAALRPEARILFMLLRENGLGMKQAISMSGLSYRGFYLMLKRLTDQNLIRIEDDRNDRRVRRLYPSNGLHEKLGQTLDGTQRASNINFMRQKM